MNGEAIDVREYPELALPCWNRAQPHIAPEDAFRLYERERRLIDPARMTSRERELPRRLIAEFGHGVIDA